MFPKQWLDNASLGEEIAADLRLKIIEKHYEAGHKLSENQLAVIYGTSRTPIRDAIKMLSSEHLVINERMGITIIGLTDKDIEEIYDIRLMIETFVFEKLIVQDNRALVEQLNKMIAMMEVAVQFKDADEFSRQDVLFHAQMIHSVNHRQIVYLWKRINPIMQTMVLISMRNRMKRHINDFERVINNHQRYVQAIEQKDRALFKQVMHLNFDDVNQHIEALWHSTIEERE